MDDYLDGLYYYLTEDCLPKAPLPPAYATQAARAEHAPQLLSNTFSQEQQSLYLTYEEAYNGLIDLEFLQLFQEIFRLARAIYR